MKSKLLLLVVGLALAVPHQSHAQASKALKWVFTLVTGAAAAESFARADEAHSVYKQKDSVIQNLKAQGIDPTDGAIYSLYFSLNGDVSSVMWADTFSKPDIFAVVQIEGQGTFLIPDIQQDYSGQPILENVIAKNATPGARILVHILDDDCLSNTIWNQILQSRIDYRVTSENWIKRFILFHGIQATTFARLNFETSGSLRLLDRNMVIDKPDYIATAEFTAPSSPDGRWLANGILHDSKNREVGKLQFAQIWRADPQLIQEAAKSHSRGIFWGVFGGVALLVGVVALFSKSQKAAT